MNGAKPPLRGEVDEAAVAIKTRSDNVRKTVAVPRHCRLDRSKGSLKVSKTQLAISSPGLVPEVDDRSLARVWCTLRGVVGSVPRRGRAARVGHGNGSGPWT